MEGEAMGGWALADERNHAVDPCAKDMMPKCITDLLESLQRGRGVARVH